MHPTIPDALRYLATHHERFTAALGGWLAWNVGIAVETATGDGGLGVLAQLGVAGLIVAALLFMLRRSDGRDADGRKALDEAEQALLDELHAQIARLEAENESLRHRPRDARTRREDR